MMQIPGVYTRRSLRAIRSRLVGSSTILAIAGVICGAGCDAIDRDIPAGSLPDSSDSAEQDVGDFSDLAGDIGGGPDTDGDSPDVRDAPDGETADGDIFEPPVAHCLLIDTTDWINSGSLAVLNLDTGELREELTNYHSDATIQIVDGDVYVVNRLFSDSVVKLDPEDAYSVEWEFSVGNRANPHQLVRYGERGFVSLYDSGTIIEVELANPTNETFLTGREIVVPSAGAFDGETAEVGEIFLHDDVLYAINEGLNDEYKCSFGARSELHAFDPETLEPVMAFEEGTASSLTLRACNAGVFEQNGSELIVRAIGNYQFNEAQPVSDGVVEVIDLAAGTQAELLATETGMGNRDIFILEQGESDIWAVLAGDDFFGIDLVRIDQTNQRWSVADELYTGYLWAVEEYDGRLFVSERDVDSAAILVFDAVTGEQLVDETIDTLAAPEELIRFDREGTTSCW